MSKTFRKNANKHYTDDSEEEYTDYKQEYYNKKINKRLKNAIRSRDIESLMGLDEDDDSF